MEPICLCGAYEELGNGVCRAGYYGGNPTPGATFESCRALCDKEEKCRFFSYERNMCRRFTGDLNSCTPLEGSSHKTYQKLKLAGRRERRADKVELQDFDYYAEYASIRGEDVALPKVGNNKLIKLEMPANSKQPCKSFGLHPELPFLEKMYNAGDLALLSNAGSLVEPVSMNDFAKKHLAGKVFPPGLFAHNVMQKNVKTVHAANGEAKGVLGRIVAELTKGTKAMQSAMYSISGYQRMLDGAMTPTIISSSNGVLRFLDYQPLAADIAKLAELQSKSVFADAYSAVLQSTLESTESLGAKLESIDLDTEFAKDSEISKQLKEVSKVIKLDVASKAERAVFYTQQGGYDTHGSHDIGDKMKALNDALEKFQAEMVKQGQWDDTVIVCTSDFGRTLTSNGQGSDHGWGGNYFIMGGGVKGKQMLGRFPTRMAEFEDESLNIGRGRMLPTTPWESVWWGVAQWLGVTDKAVLETILPHAKNFKGALFEKSDLFDN